METVERVWCDMDANKGDFYLYIGSIKSPQSLLLEKNNIGKACSKYNLEPVKIISKEQFKNVLRFLNGMDAVTLTDYGVPLLYRPD
jgi:hypothetical protein